MWYDVIQHKILRMDKENKDINTVSFKLNEVTTLTKPKTWFKFMTRMPESVSCKANEIQSELVTLVHNMEKVDNLVIIFGTKDDPKREKKIQEVVLKKGVPFTRPFSFWITTEFAIVDFNRGYDSKRMMYWTQKFTVDVTCKRLEVKFKEYPGGNGNGEFVVFDQTCESSECQLDGQIEQYSNVKEQSEDAKSAMEKYN